MSYIKAQKTSGQPASPISIPSWSNGTEDEISAALQAHYAGEIDLTQYWSVGDERTIHLAAIGKPSWESNMETQEEQDAIFIILHGPGMYDLADPIYEGKKNAFVIGMKDCLSTAGPINANSYPSSGGSIGWNGVHRRRWLKECFPNALPSKVKTWFKRFYYPASFDYEHIGILDDYFTLPSIKELRGNVQNVSYYKYAEEGTVFDYYKDSTYSTANARQKKKMGINGTYTAGNAYYSRSPYAGYSSPYYFRGYKLSGSGSSSVLIEDGIGTNGSNGISPFGVV